MIQTRKKERGKDRRLRKMAVVSRTDDKDTRESNLVSVDINDTDLADGLESDIDAEADAYDIPSPPPTDNYRLKLFLGSDGYKHGLMDENDPESIFYQAALECRIVDNKDHEGRILFPRVDTRVWPGRDTSTMATLVNKILKGGKKPQAISGKVTAKKMLKLFDKLLKKEPIVAADCDWSIWSGDEEGRRGRKGRTFITGMVNFPEKDGGGYQHIVADKFGNRCVARLFVDRWTDEHKSGATSSVAKATVPGTGKAVKPVVETEDEFGDLAGLDDL